MTRKGKTLIALFLVGTSTIAAWATNDTIGVSAGSGKTANLIKFLSNAVISETGICDATTENQCAAVSAGGAVKVDGSAATQPVSQATSSNLKAQVDPLTAASWGIGTSTQNSTTVTNGQLILGQFNTTPTTITSTNMSPFQLDANGNLLVNVKVGGGAITMASGSVSSGAYASGALASGSVATGAIVDLGQQSDSACATDNGVCSLIALTKRTNQNVAGSIAAGSAVIGKVGIDQSIAGTSNAVALVGINGATALAGNGVTGTGAQRVTIASDNSALPAAGQGATAATAPSGATQGGCRAASTDPTAVTDGQMAGVQCGLSGKQVVLPYTIKELAIRGTVTTTGSGAVTIIASAGGSLKNYITGVQCWNSSANAVTITFDDVETTGSGTQLFLPSAGGNNAKFDIPLVTAAATAFTFQVTTGGAQTTIGCNAQGYTGL